MTREKRRKGGTLRDIEEDGDFLQRHRWKNINEGAKIGQWQTSHQCKIWNSPPNASTMNQQPITNMSVNDWNVKSRGAPLSATNKPIKCLELRTILQEGPKGVQRRVHIKVIFNLLTQKHPVVAQTLQCIWTYSCARTHAYSQIRGTECDLWNPFSLNPASGRVGGERRRSNLRTWEETRKLSGDLYVCVIGLWRNCQHAHHRWSPALSK